MKKKQKIYKDMHSLIKSLKKMKVTKKDDGLLKSAHRLLSLQLQAVKNTAKKLDDSLGVIFYDSRILPLPDGVRPAAVETARLKYQIGEKQLQISLYPVSPERFEVMGRLGGISSGKIIKVTLKADRKKLSTSSNEFQIFRFQNIPKASFEMEFFDGIQTIAKVTLDL